MFFLEKFVAILNDESEIPGISNDALTMPECGGSLVSCRLSKLNVIKILRLQTLMKSEDEKGAIKDVVFSSHAIEIEEDAIRSAMMVEQAITEVVRSIIPTECERLNVIYFIRRDENGKLGLYWEPLPQKVL